MVSREKVDLTLVGACDANVIEGVQHQKATVMGGGKCSFPEHMLLLLLFAC
jgi:hypothetical protein